MNKILRTLVWLLIVAAGGFCYGFLVGRFELFPYPVVASMGKAGTRFMKVLRYG